MRTKSEAFIIADETPWIELGGGVRRQIMGYDGQLMMVKVAFEKGAIGAAHQHFHSQGCYVASGKFEVDIAGERRTLSAGDGFFVLPDVIHGVVCLEAGMLIDTFTPHRFDFLPKEG